MLWGILIGFAGTISLEFLILWAIRRKLSKSGEGKVLSPRELLKKGDKWDGKFVVYRSDGKPLDKKARFFLMKFDETGQEPERQALQLYADLIESHDPEMSEKVKTAVRETQIKE